MVNNDLTVSGNLSVTGTTTSTNFETAVAKENVIITNSDNAALVNNLSGIAINTGKVNDDTPIAYGIMYDSSDDLIKLGLGRVT